MTLMSLSRDLGRNITRYGLDFITSKLFISDFEPFKYTYQGL